MQLFRYIVVQLKKFYSENEAKAMARLILEDYFSISMQEIYMDKDITILANRKNELDNILFRLANYEPIQYVLGKTTFCGFQFEVSPGVLIPRPETEELVEWICQSEKTTKAIFEVGTGSGCISIALSLRNPETKVVSCDISEEALKIAIKNNRSLKATVQFQRCDILSDVPTGKFDIIVSNPPYICPSEKREMERNVLDWEPGLALFVPQNDPLLFYRRISFLGKNLLKEGGSLYFEINPIYMEILFNMLRTMGYVEIESHQDFRGNVRMIRAQLKQNSI